MKNNKLDFSWNDFENLRKLKDIIDIAIEWYVDVRDREDFLDVIIEYCISKQRENSFWEPPLTSPNTNSIAKDFLENNENY